MEPKSNSEEIDLGYLLKKSGDFFKSLLRGFFMIVDFFIKFYIVIIVLIIIGVIIGFYKDKNAVESYNNELIVIPNFESADYLYDKVAAINTKIAMGDSIYLKSILNDNFGNLKGIKIEPIVDIYDFVSKKRENIDIFRIIAEKQDYSEYVEDVTKSKYYKYHRLNITTRGTENSKEIVRDLLAYINTNPHFVEYKTVYKNVKDFEVKQYYDMVAQIDSLIKASATRNEAAASSVKVITNNDQHYLIEKKQDLLEDLTNLKMEQLDYTEPVKIVNVDYNLKTKRFLSISNKVKYPILLILLFSGIFLVIYMFKSMRKYSESN